VMSLREVPGSFFLFLFFQNFGVYCALSSAQSDAIGALLLAWEPWVAPGANPLFHYLAQ